MGRSVLPRGCIAIADRRELPSLCGCSRGRRRHFSLTGGLAKDRGHMAGLYYYHVDIVKYGLRVIEDEFLRNG